MAKTFYDDYVNRMLRYYFGHDGLTGLEKKVDTVNYISVDKVMKKLSEKEKQLIREIYTDKEPIGVSIRAVASKHNISPSVLWDLRYSVTIKIAKKRGLV